MNSRKTYPFLAFGVILVILVGITGVANAQQTDTTQTKEKLETQRKALQQYHSERSTHGYVLTESGTYNVPEPTEYYKPPFTGQESLDRAVAFYRQEFENSIANTKLFQIIAKVAPFITNSFQFGFYQIYDLPIVERDHPLLEPQIKEENQ